MSSLTTWWRHADQLGVLGNCGGVARGEREIGFRLHGSTLRERFPEGLGSTMKGARLKSGKTLASKSDFRAIVWFLNWLEIGY
jgi:hypothetical protein